ncbi:alpha/beta fold hydrolase [Oceaniglobus indicus]|uniref:alpha/beta fold hydrolase n=1 Tax=Oceaniglobus indicus TaxID=2047749 RepID=UPI000C1A3002|nr:alpha/beta fold hydrolase [Oceaniglobus indicus]
MTLTDRRITIEGRTVAYGDAGSGGPVPLVLLHGAGFDRADPTWRATFEAFKTTRRVVAPDLPGHGDSEGFGVPHDIARLGQWLIAFMDALGIERADLAGESMGGGIALWMALEHPARVRRLTLAGSYGMMDRMPFHRLADPVRRSGALALAYKAAENPVVARAALGFSHGGRVPVHKDDVNELRREARDLSERRTFDDFLVGELDGTGVRSDFTARLGELQMPVMLVHGLSDRVISADYARHAATLIPDVRLHLMETGHWPMREQPETFIALLHEFLGDQPDVVTANR